ncbi:hypothetical protein EAH72_30775 [Pseudomonas caspiana]|nr:hypothetical protein EAH72_30775 [Pseudomonas caspiana]
MCTSLGRYLTLADIFMLSMLPAQEAREGLKYPLIFDALAARGSKNQTRSNNQTFFALNSWLFPIIELFQGD